MIQAAKRASEIIQRVRSLATKSSIDQASIDINNVISDAIALVRLELIKHGVRLRTELAPALPVIFADRVQLQQVIINLVMNGSEAMEGVTERPRELMIRSQQDEARRVVVTVEDRGVGISTENANRLFTAFFTTKSSGIGMGLSICRSIIELHGGEISAVNNAGPGATFRFTLPPIEDQTERTLKTGS
jgi:signal transduction histidine kinase